MLGGSLATRINKSVGVAFFGSRQNAQNKEDEAAGEDDDDDDDEDQQDQAPSSTDANLPAYHAVARILQAGQDGLNGREAFSVGMGEQQFKLFIHRVTRGAAHHCAFSSKELQWLAGDGGSRVSTSFSLKGAFADVSCALSTGFAGPLGVSYPSRRDQEVYTQLLLQASAHLCNNA